MLCSPLRQTRKLACHLSPRARQRDKQMEASSGCYAATFPAGKARSYIAFIILITVGRGLAPAGNDKFPQTNGNENLQICYFLFSFIYGGSKHQYNRKLFSLYPQTRMAFPQGKASFFQKFSKAVGARAASQRRYPDKRHPAARRAAALPATGGNYLG